jgi:hypothetical protein
MNDRTSLRSHGSRGNLNNQNSQRQSIDIGVRSTNNDLPVNHSRPSLGRRQPADGRQPVGEGLVANDGGFLSMSRFAQMSFEEARTNLHPSVRNSMGRPAQSM